MLTEDLLRRIDADPHIGPQFVSLYEPFHVEENPAFLLAVVRYKKNPTWDSCLSVYHKHISDKAKHQANFSSPSRERIENYIKARSDSQKAFAGAGVKLHYGPADAHVFDDAFRDVLSGFDRQLDANQQQRALTESFLTKYNLMP